MTAPKKILFPTDLSESAERLVPFVKTMTTRFSAELHVLYIARLFQYFTAIYVPHPSISMFEQELVDGAEKRMEEFQKEHFAEISDVTATVILGDAAEQILSYATENKIDMIIMGTHGRKGLDKIIFGSVAEKVVKSSPIPVLIINPYKV